MGAAVADGTASMFIGEATVRDIAGADAEGDGCGLTGVLASTSVSGSLRPSGRKPSPPQFSHLHQADLEEKAFVSRAPIAELVVV